MFMVVVVSKIDQFIDKKTLEGGTGMVAFGELASLMNSKTSGVDESGLGRWTYMEFIGANGHSTMILCGYAPCYNNRANSGTTYQQHQRYFIEHEGQVDEPRARFLADLTRLLEKWKEEGKRIIVCMDANENVYKGIIGRTLTDTEGLDMVETVSATHGTPLTATRTSAVPVQSMRYGPLRISRWSMPARSRLASGLEIIECLSSTLPSSLWWERTRKLSHIHKPDG
jgi:hypothetical protein